jgi:hypothetical protein
VKNGVAARMSRTYRPYLKSLLSRYARGKSFFVRSEMVPLYDYFVPLDLGNEVRLLQRPDAATLGSAAPFATIIGSGGSGKSMMMRHLVVSCIRSGEKTPIPLELRQLSRDGTDLQTALVRSAQSFGLDMDNGFLRAAIESGNLMVLLDGFDEVDQERRQELVREVRDLSQMSPDNWIILSSRPDRTLEGWEDFTELRLQPLTLDAAIELVEKAPFDAAVKGQFVDRMRGGFLNPTIPSYPIHFYFR